MSPDEHQKVRCTQEHPTEQHHTLWLQDGFDYPSKTEQETMYTLPNIKVKLSQSQDLPATRKAFFDMAISLQTSAADDDMALGDDARANEVKVVRESIRSYRRVVVLVWRYGCQSMPLVTR